MSAETQIANLLYRYAECMDSGDFAGAAALFEHARLRVGGGGDGTIGAATILGIWTSTVMLYPDGTLPRKRGYPHAYTSSPTRSSRSTRPQAPPRVAVTTR